jgi:hypothetical protein
MNKLRFTFCVLLAIIYSGSLFAQSETHRLTTPVTDYAVYDIQQSNGYSLLRGYFYQAGKYSGSIVATDPATGNEDLSWPVISGDILAVTPDGNGGFYAGGNIRGVDNEDVGNLVHILPNKTLDRNFLPNPFGSVYALELRDNILYVGGTFVNIGGESRYYAAAIDVTTRTITPWNPHLNNHVTSIKVTDTSVILAGLFTQVNNGAILRNKIAAVEKTSGNVISGWDLALDGSAWNVYSLTASASTLYVGGSFSTANGIDRSGLVAVSLSNATVDATWNPAPTAFGTPVVHSLALTGTTLYVGGYFNGGLGGDNTIRHLGAVSTSGAGAAINTFKPVFDAPDQVYNINLSGSTLYVSGSFNSVNGLTRPTLAAINISNGTPTAWTAELQGFATIIAATGSSVFVAGDIYGINWNEYNGLAIIDESTGEFWPHTLSLAVGEDIEAMVVIDNTMYVGGNFDAINGVSRKNLAAIDLTTGTILPWNPGASGTTSTSGDDTRVTALEYKDNKIYVAGKFLNAGGQGRRGLASIDATTGAVTAWNPGVGDGTSMDEYILSMDVHENTLFVAGTFNSLAGQSRSFLGAVDLANATATDWNPEAFNEVRKIRVTQNTAYILGDFSDGIAGVARPFGIAALDITSGEATSFNPDFNSSSVADFALTDTDIYIGGYFSTASNEPRPGLASFSLSSGLLNSWNPDLGSAGEGNYDVASLAASLSRLYVGGGFMYVGNENRTGYVEYDLSSCTLAAAITLDGATLTTTSGETFQWYENDVLVPGATSQTYEINIFEYGRYAVEITSDGCTARSEDYIYLVTDRENEHTSIVRYYPNPVSEKLFIEVSSEATLTVLDLAGKTVAISPLSFQEVNQISVSHWMKGAYILKVQNNKATQTFKVIKTN